MDGDCFDLFLFASSFFFFLIYINYPAFWNKSFSEMKRKQTEGKCRRRPPRASNHIISFPTDVIFSNRKRPEVGISQKVLTVTHWLFVEGEKTIFLPKSWPSITTLQGSLYNGIPFDMGACSNIQSPANSGGHEILLHRMGTAGFPRGFNPHQTVEHQEQHRQHLLTSCLPFNPARMEMSFISEVVESSTAFKPSKQRKSTLCFVWFHWPAAKPPKPWEGSSRGWQGRFSLILF